jgi:nucleolar MIF4G domain-containing protein 1
MGLICERSVLQDTFLVLHAGFIAALYKIMGMDFGAEIVQRVVETLDAEGDEGRGFEGKEGMNLVSLLAQLYNFHVIGSPLIFDYIRLFLAEITESNTELLLKVIRSKYFFLNRHPIFSLLIHPQIVVPSFDKTTRLL